MDGIRDSGQVTTGLRPEEEVSFHLRARHDVELLAHKCFSDQRIHCAV